ncbi:MAG: hypothetical protein Q8K37_03535 [Alphaproteobacteria bacterium]|nr:hypothetical protein [Alphaproteobacteria bacterium]
MMPATQKLRKLTRDEFTKLGNKKFCYLKIEDTGDDEESFVLYNADGTCFAHRYSKDSALDLLDSNNINLINVH